MGCRVHEEVRSLRQSEGRMEGNEGGERIAEDRSHRTQRHCRASGVDSEGGGAPGGWSRWMAWTDGTCLSRITVAALLKADWEREAGAQGYCSNPRAAVRVPGDTTAHPSGLFEQFSQGTILEQWAGCGGTARDRAFFVATLGLKGWGRKLSEGSRDREWCLERDAWCPLSLRWRDVARVIWLCRRLQNTDANLLFIPSHFLPMFPHWPNPVESVAVVQGESLLCPSIVAIWPSTGFQPCTFFLFFFLISTTAFTAWLQPAKS